MRPALADLLDLQPHPEGGWYRQTWVSPARVTLPDGRDRATATLILFALPAGEASRWHRVASDETWLAHTGSVVLELGGSDALPRPRREPGGRVVVGLDLAAGEAPQALVPAGEWQRTRPGPRDALVSCLVSPGFDPADFELLADEADTDEDTDVPRAPAGPDERPVDLRVPTNPA